MRIYFLCLCQLHCDRPMSRFYNMTREVFPIMAPEMSTDLKQRMVTWYLEDSLTHRDIARLAGCSIGRVVCIISATTVKYPFTSYRNWSSIYCARWWITHLFSLLAANPVLYLDELQTWLSTVVVSISQLLWFPASLPITSWRESTYKGLLVSSSKSDKKWKNVSSYCDDHRFIHFNAPNP
jgi:hypothetical protein